MPLPHTTRMSSALPLTARRWSRAACATVAALMGVGLGAGASVAPAAAAPVPAQSAGAYRDSVGVQMHHSFTGYAYQTESADSLGAALRALGIRHVRDSVCLNTEQACAPIRAKLADLRDALGPGAPSVDLLLQLTQELKSEPDRADRDADIERALHAVQSAPLAGMVSGLEAVNEPDLKNNVDWQAKTLADDATTTRLLAEPRFAAARAIPRLTPAVGHATNTPLLLNAGWLGTRNYTPNFHPYPPAWGGPENGLTTPCSGTDALGCVRQLASGGAPIASESGYTTAGGAFSQGWVSEKAQAVYLPRLLLENFSRGVARTYLYELVDLSPERTSTTNGYGLWRSRRSGSTVRAADPKPAAWAVARLHARIGDLGSAAAPTSPLDLTFRVGGRTVDTSAVRRTLLQRADGSYALALWQPKSVFDNAYLAQRDRAVADVNVEVSIGTPRTGGWAATAFRPTRSGDAVGRVSPTSRFTAPVGADVTLIDLRSAQAPESTIPGQASALNLGGVEPIEAAPGITQEDGTPVVETGDSTPPSGEPAPAPAAQTAPAPVAPAATGQAGTGAAVSAPALTPTPDAAKTKAAATTKAAAKAKAKARAKAKAKAKAKARKRAKAAAKRRAQAARAAKRARAGR